MCDPFVFGPAMLAIGEGAFTSAPVLAALTTTVAGASAGMQYMGQQQQAKAQNAMAEANARSAASSFRLQQQQLQGQLLQQRSQLEQQDVSQTIASERLKSQIRVSSAEAGLSGVSLDSIVGQADRERAMQEAVNGRNFSTMQRDELTREGNAYFQMQNQVNSVPGGIFPSLITPLLSTAGAGLNTYGTYMYDPGKRGGSTNYNFAPNRADYTGAQP